MGLVINLLDQMSLMPLSTTNRHYQLSHNAGSSFSFSAADFHMALQKPQHFRQFPKGTWGSKFIATSSCTNGCGKLPEVQAFIWIHLWLLMILVLLHPIGDIGDIYHTSATKRHLLAKILGKHNMLVTVLHIYYKEKLGFSNLNTAIYPKDGKYETTEVTELYY